MLYLNKKGWVEESFFPWVEETLPWLERKFPQLYDTVVSYGHRYIEIMQTDWYQTGCFIYVGFLLVLGGLSTLGIKIESKWFTWIKTVLGLFFIPVGVGLLIAKKVGIRIFASFVTTVLLVFILVPLIGLGAAYQFLGVDISAVWAEYMPYSQQFPIGEWVERLTDLIANAIKKNK